ncbi:hypothetical protein SCUCBS95973_002727 [Sporothrix curviconia]|uniref:Uncharacterized protein n=1 Tax=Sporothrix curviconia TaxID=1260050 RepID=A0ABP0B9D9_9PEZI
MSELLFAMHYQALDMPRSMPSLSFKPAVSHFENGLTEQRRTADVHDSATSPSPAAQSHHGNVPKKEKDGTNETMPASPPPRAPLLAEAKSNILSQDQQNYRVEPQIAQTLLALSTGSPLLRLPLEIRLQIYRWALLLGTAGPASNNTLATDPSVSPPSTPCFFDGPRHFGPGDGFMFIDLFSANAHKIPVEYRAIKLESTPSEDNVEHEQERRQHGRKEAQGQDSPLLLAAHRPVGRGLPVGLLTSCRQIYGEARLLALETSEFVFVRLFSSGLSTAHAFIVLGSQTYPGNIGGVPPKLRPWQRDHLRYMRLELDVSVADMGWRGPERDPMYVGDRATTTAMKQTKQQGPTIVDAAKWLALCDALGKGLQGLRILLNITEERHQQSGDESAYEENGSEAAAADVAQSILVQGFRRLTALRQLEIELAWVLRGRFRSRAANMMPAATRANLTWCASVETAINNERQMLSTAEAAHRPVSTKVVCVERIYDKEKKAA